MNINIEHLHITINVNEAEPVKTPVQEIPVRRGHRDSPKIDEHKQRMLELKQQQKQLQLQVQAQRLQHKFRIAERLRQMLGDDVANSVLGGVA